MWIDNHVNRLYGSLFTLVFTFVTAGSGAGVPPGGCWKSQ
jgi:hypothetical protein